MKSASILGVQRGVNKARKDRVHGSGVTGGIVSENFHTSHPKPAYSEQGCLLAHARCGQKFRAGCGPKFRALEEGEKLNTCLTSVLF